MSQNSRPYQPGLVRDGRRTRRLMFELLEDRRVLSGLYGSEPSQNVLSENSLKCMERPASEQQSPAPSFSRIHCQLQGDTDSFASADGHFVTGFYIYNVFDLQPQVLSAEGSGNSNFATLSSSRLVSVGSQGSLVLIDRGTLNWAPASSITVEFDHSASSPLIGQVRETPNEPNYVPDRTPAIILSPPLQIKPTDILSPSPQTDQPDIIVSPSSDSSLFRTSHIVEPLTWTISADVAHASQRKFLVGSSDALLSATQPSRSVNQSSLHSARNDLGSVLKSKAVTDRRVKLQFDRNHADSLNLVHRVNSLAQSESQRPQLEVLGKSIRAWSRLTSAALRTPQIDEPLYRADDVVSSANAASEATEVARDIIFAELAAQEIENTRYAVARNSVPNNDPNRKNESE